MFKKLVAITPLRGAEVLRLPVGALDTSSIRQGLQGRDGCHVSQTLRMFSVDGIAEAAEEDESHPSPPRVRDGHVCQEHSEFANSLRRIIAS